MEQLIQQITDKYEISEADATDIINTVKNYQTSNTDVTNAGAITEQKTEQPAADAVQAAPVAEVKKESMLEKAEDFVKDHIPGGLKEKAEEVFSGIGSKVKGLFS
jgi:hypothetical protein